MHWYPAMAVGFLVASLIALTVAAIGHWRKEKAAGLMTPKWSVIMGIGFALLALGYYLRS